MGVSELTPALVAVEDPEGGLTAGAAVVLVVLVVVVVVVGGAGVEGGRGGAWGLG